MSAFFDMNRPKNFKSIWAQRIHYSRFTAAAQTRELLPEMYDDIYSEIEGSIGKCQTSLQPCFILKATFKQFQKLQVQSHCHPQDVVTPVNTVLSQTTADHRSLQVKFWHHNILWFCNQCQGQLTGCCKNMNSKPYSTLTSLHIAYTSKESLRWRTEMCDEILKANNMVVKRIAGDGSGQFELWLLSNNVNHHSINVGQWTSSCSG